MLLLSTYDLGRQPFGLASPAAWLRRAGIAVEVQDLSRETLDPDLVRRARLVAVYLPMHTATRLAMPVIDRVRAVNPEAAICAYGLYAPLNEPLLRACGVTHILGPEFEEELTEIGRGPGRSEEVRGGPGRFEEVRGGPGRFEEVRGGSGRSEEVRGDPGRFEEVRGGSGRFEEVREGSGRSGTIPRLPFIQPDRAGLPPPARYATLQMPDGTRRTTGSTDATRGCKHRCRHCPIVPVYDGQFRVVPVDVVLADIRAQVAAGVQHVTFADPDFLNGPTHARRIVEALHAEWPSLTYDATIKVEHLVNHRDLLPVLASTGCLFVTSAVEAVDDRVLRCLDKGHTRADFLQAVALCRDAGLTLAPTFVAFTPWTTIDGYRDLLDTVAALDLIPNVAPVQWGIRLLVTWSSPLLELEDIRRRVVPFDAKTLTYPWTHPDPQVDRLQAAIMNEVGVRITSPRAEIFDRVRQLADDRAQSSSDPEGSPLQGRVVGQAVAGRLIGDQPGVRARATIPYLNEPWYC